MQAESLSGICTGFQLIRHSARLVGALLLCGAPAFLGFAQVSVTNCTEADLRAALAAGQTVSFAVDGVLTLGAPLAISHDTTLDARGRQVTLSGGRAVPLFYVGTNTTLTLLHLTVAEGAGTNGGAIYNDGGTLNLLDTAFVTNTALSQALQTDVRGGALFNRAGTINATNCTFVANACRPGFGSAWGGALCNQGGLVRLQQCTFLQNAASAPDWSYDLALVSNDAGGGAVHNAGSLFASGCTFVLNTAAGGQGRRGTSQWPGGWVGTGGTGGSAQGGAICNLGLMAVERSLWVSNTATGGLGGPGAGAYAPLPDFGWPAGPGGTGGAGCGGDLFNHGTASLVNCLLAWNGGIGGIGGTGGPPAQASGGGGEMGGMGGNGGNGYGSIMDTNGLLALTNCTLAFCSATAGVIGVLQGYSGPTPTNGIGVGGITAAGTRLINTLLASNAPAGNCQGTLADLGHNLSSDSTCHFTQAGSLNQTDPKLGLVPANGGPAPTLALLPGSPAIDAADSAAAPASDLRGFPRPFGPAPDIGAYEYWPSPPTLQLSRCPTGGVDLLVFAPAGQLCRLFSSTGLVSWTAVATNLTGPNGTLLFHDSSSQSRQFYRVLSP